MHAAHTTNVQSFEVPRTPYTFVQPSTTRSDIVASNEEYAQPPLFIGRLERIPVRFTRQ